MTKAFAVFGLAFVLFAIPAQSFAASEYDPAALPRDKATLQKLNDEQVALLRRAARACNDLSTSVHTSSVCVMGTVDGYVRDQNDPALKAFHFSLKPRDRYDELRNLDNVHRMNEQ